MSNFPRYFTRDNYWRQLREHSLALTDRIRHAEAENDNETVRLLLVQKQDNLKAIRFTEKNLIAINERVV